MVKQTSYYEKLDVLKEFLNRLLGDVHPDDVAQLVKDVTQVSVSELLGDKTLYFRVDVEIPYLGADRPETLEYVQQQAREQIAQKWNELVEEHYQA